MNGNFVKLLTTIDFINKYNLKTMQKKPILNKTIIYFSLSKIQSYSKTTLKTNDANAQMKLFLFFFLFFAKIPKVNFKKSSLSLQNNYAFKILITAPKKLNDLLIYLFIENSSKLKQKNILNIDNSKNKVKKFLIINRTVESQNLHTIEYAFKSVFKDFKINNFNFNISFIFSNPTCKTDSFIPNLFLFWVQGLK